MIQILLHLLQELCSLLHILVLKEQHWTLVGKAVYLIDISTNAMILMILLLVDFYLMIIYLNDL